MANVKRFSKLIHQKIPHKRDMYITTTFSTNKGLTTRSQYFHPTGSAFLHYLEFELEDSNMPTVLSSSTVNSCLCPVNFSKFVYKPTLKKICNVSF